MHADQVQRQRAPGLDSKVGARNRKLRPRPLPRSESRRMYSASFTDDGEAVRTSASACAESLSVAARRDGEAVARGADVLRPQASLPGSRTTITVTGT